MLTLCWLIGTSGGSTENRIIHEEFGREDCGNAKQEAAIVIAGRILLKH